MGSSQTKALKELGEANNISFSDVCIIDDSGSIWLMMPAPESDDAFSPIKIDSAGNISKEINFQTSGSEPETAFYRYVRGKSVSIREVINISPVANSAEVLHHIDWEREAGVIMRLAFMGSDSHDELETVFQCALRRGLALSSSGYEIEMPDSRIRDLMIRILAMSRGDMRHPLSDEYASYYQEVDSVLRTFLYSRYAYAWLGNNPDLVSNFIETDEFAGIEPTLINHSMVSIGQSRFQRARSVLANTMIWKFEGYAQMSDSPTQCQWANLQDCFDKATDYLMRNKAPVVQYNAEEKNDLAQSQYKQLQKLRVDLQLINALPDGINEPSSAHWKNALEHNLNLVFASKLQSIMHEIQRRQKYHPIFLDALDRLGFHVDHRRRHSVLTTLIGNVSMAKVLTPNTKMPYTAHAAYPNSLGFITDVRDDDLAFLLRNLHQDGTDIPDSLSNATIEQALLYVFSGFDYGNKEDFEARSLRLKAISPLIMYFLRYDYRVPENIRKISEVISDPHLVAREALKQSDPVWADNPYYINIFGHKGLDDYQNTVYLSWVQDFVNGVETELKLQEEDKLARIKRRWIGWEPLSYKPSIFQISNAVDAVLKNAYKRILFVDHVVEGQSAPESQFERVLHQIIRWPGRQPSSVRDYLDIFEVIFGSFVPSAEYRRKFLRWNKWTDLLAESWRCFCQVREQRSFFNSRTVVTM